MIHTVTLATINLHLPTKFDVFISTHNKDMKKIQNIENGVV